MKWFNRFYIVYIIFLIISLFSSCTKTNTIPVKEYIYVPVKDSIGEKENIAKIIELEYKLKLTQDSLQIVQDSLGADIFVLRYKLYRIKEYNRIAGQGNNIKYLRGWINRVLNE